MQSPGGPVPPHQQPIGSGGPHIVAVQTPHIKELTRGPARLHRPVGSVSLQDGPIGPDCPEVGGIRAPDALQLLDGGACLRGPGGAVPLEDGVKEFFRAVDGGLIKATYT